MMITVTVPVSVTVELDMTDTEAACFQDGQDLGLENLRRSVARGVILSLHRAAEEEGMADDMVDAISDETGWCLRSLSLETDNGSGDPNQP